MQDEHWAQAFNEEVTRAEGRHQQAIAEAHAEHKRAVAALREQQAAEPPEGNWDFQYSRHVRELKALDDALDAAVRKADAAYHEEVAQIGREHGVAVR